MGAGRTLDKNQIARAYLENGKGWNYLRQLLLGNLWGQKENQTEKDGDRRHERGRAKTEYAQNFKKQAFMENNL